MFKNIVLYKRKYSRENFCVVIFQSKYCILRRKNMLQTVSFLLSKLALFLFHSYSEFVYYYFSPNNFFYYLYYHYQYNKILLSLLVRLLVSATVRDYKSTLQ